MGRVFGLTLVGLCCLACSSAGDTPGSTSSTASTTGSGTGPSVGAGGVAGSSTSGQGGSSSGGQPIDAASADRSEEDVGTSIPIDGSGGAPPGVDAKPDAASATDTGVSDGGGSTDARSAACPAGALFCEDFDKYASAAELTPGWRVTATAATLTVDATKPFGPTGKALHVVAAAGTPNAVILKEGAPLFPIAGNVMYGRVMMWLTQTPGGNYHWNNFQSAGTIPNSTRNGKYGWGGQNGKVLAGYTVRETPTGAAVIDCSKPSAMAIPEKRWVCVEWKFDGVGNEMHYWFDGALLADVDVVRTGTRCVNAGDIGSIWQAPVFANLTVGWAQYQASTGALELWMDDLAVGTQPLGCPAP